MTDRTSRQDLVVSPPTSRIPFAVTAGGSACIGFALVWGVLAAGRVFPKRSQDTDPARVEMTSDAEPASTVPQTVDVTVEPSGPSDPFAAAAPAPLPADRYARRTARFVSTVPEEPRAATDPREHRYGGSTGPSFPSSRFDQADAAAADDPGFPGGDVMAVSAVEDAAVGADATLEPVAASPDAPPPTDVPTVGDTASGTVASPLPEDRGDLGAFEPAPSTAPPEAGSEMLDASASANADPGEPPPAAFVAPPAADPAPGPFPDPSPLPPAPPALPAPTAHPAAWNTSGSGIHDDPGAPVPAAALPRGTVDAAPLASAMPFAAAPPLVNPVPAGASDGPSGAGAAPPPPPAAGQGRPGPIHLEGVQTPQLAVEKRGPREIQVGKTARFEIIVRNVGSAQANDVVLRDSVPFGTALVATTPPAAPAPAGGDPGDLVWLLGALPPGGQVRVGVDLMPLSEGDVGSVASVSFRADASVRTRATRPALEITAQPPSPVLVGGDSRLTITISNPGSGVATGVILESILPEGLAHRAGSELEFDVGTLPPGESRSIDLLLATTGPGVHGLRLSARADGQIEVTDTVKVAVTAPTLDLAVAMPSRRYLQRPATCTISMTNAGTAPAVGVELVAQLPPGLKFVRANNSGYYEERTHRVLWNLEELPAAETGEVEVVLMPVALGPQKIVTAARTPSGLSDQIAHTVEVEGLAALAFEVADSEDPIEVGGVSEYVIRVGNQGTKPASGVRVVATLLGDLEPVEARGPSPHRVDNLTVSFEPLAKLAPSEEALYRIRVRGRREGDQRVQVQLTSDEQPAPLTKEETTRVYADR